MAGPLGRSVADLVVTPLERNDPGEGIASLTEAMIGALTLGRVVPMMHTKYGLE